MRRRRVYRVQTTKGWDAEGNQKLYTRSNLERRAIEILEADPDVLRYEWEPFQIPYRIGKGRLRDYTPDIFVYYSSGELVLIEVKPTGRVHQRKVQAKAAAAIAWCNQALSIRYEFWTEKDLWK